MRGEVRLRALARRLRPLPVPPLPSTPFARFERDDAPPVELLDGYRDAIKGGWRLYWWYTQVLFGVRARVGLPPDLEDLAQAILAARTLTAPPAEIARAVARLADGHPQHVRWSEIEDRTLGVARLDLVPTADERHARVASYEATAHGVLAAVGRHGVEVTSARALEIGCGTGYLTFALAAAGAREAVGIDVDLETYVGAAERALVAGSFDGAERARLETADACSLPYEDDSFDIVVSISALEHVADTPGALQECHRVLRPGGIAYHAVDPWFSPQGGHGLCVLDFPWGHVRLTEAELGRYLAEHRPHEARDAIDMYQHGFQRPRLRAAEVERAAVNAGFRVAARHQSRDGYRNHRPLAGHDLVRECARLHPGVTASDLLLPAYTLVLRKRGRGRGRPQTQARLASRVP